VARILRGGDGISQVSQSHDEYGKVVHRPCSSYISSIQKIIGTLLSSPY